MGNNNCLLQPYAQNSNDLNILYMYMSLLLQTEGFKTSTLVKQTKHFYLYCFMHFRFY